MRPVRAPPLYPRGDQILPPIISSTHSQRSRPSYTPHNRPIGDLPQMALTTWPDKWGALKALTRTLGYSMSAQGPKLWSEYNQGASMRQNVDDNTTRLNSSTLGHSSRLSAESSLCAWYSRGHKHTGDSVAIRRSTPKYADRVGKRLARSAADNDPGTLWLAKEEEERRISEYLCSNRSFLDNYVKKHISVAQIERWTAQKVARPYGHRAFTHIESRRDCARMNNKEIFMRILSVLRVEPSPYLMIYELTLYMSNVVGADDVRVYALTPSHPSRVQRIVMGMSMVPHLVNIAADKAELLLKVAAGGSTVLETRPDNPDRYNLTSVRMLVDDDSDERYMMLQPVLGSDGKPAFVVEFNRKWQPFSTEDTNNSSHFLVWGSLLILWCDMYTSKNRTWDVTEFTLEVVKDIFEEMVAMTQVIKKILEAAQRLVNADRASLFLVDWRNKELISTVFDLRVEPGAEDKVEVTELRLPLDKGIVGHVATSGETMNIPDAYADARFNREIDEKTGYKTVSILCMPVKVKGKVFGIVQMVNKRNEEHFTHEDEVSFREFSTFFGLALHHAKLYEKIQRKEQKHKVALDVLKYHNTCKEDEVEELLKDDFEGSQPACDLTDFYLNPFKLNELAKCHRFLAMFDNLFDMGNFDKNTLAHFVLTVKKNYRAVPYHNFDHGWSVAHTMYCILTNDTLHRFNHNERLALFVSCLCHDLDHRGYTNKYMSEISSPLAAMYSTSTLEHHHFNITVMILQQDNHNILGNLTSEDYKEVLGYIRQCILATDLAAFFPNLEKMKELCAEKPKFDWENRIHRNLAMAISMTAADLSASCKPWEIQLKTVKVIVEEFYHQGDEEKRLGKTPVPMMDREKPNEQTESQIGFLSQICVPAYTILWKIMPRTIPLYFMVTRNLKAWQAIKARQMNEKSDNGGNSTLSDVPDISADSSSYNGDDTKGVCRYQSEKTKEEEMQAEERAEAARLDEACGGVDEVGGESVAETEARNLGQASDHVLDEQSWTDDDVVVASGNGDLLALLRELSTD